MWSIVLLGVAATATTLVEGAPTRPPGVALGSGVLLHAERTLALVAIALAGITLLVRAADGHLPVELSTSGVKYEPVMTDRLAENVAELEAELTRVAEEVRSHADSLDALRRRS